MAATLLPATAAEQLTDFRSGNEAAALAARDIGFHVMGYFPITPSTEVAENLSKMQADGEHEIVMVAGDGEHGAAGICYGAALGGGRVLNATSSQGLLLLARAAAGAGGHARADGAQHRRAHRVRARSTSAATTRTSTYALNTGWIMLCARDPQAVYDLNFAAREDRRASRRAAAGDGRYDGFFTSHQKRRIQVFDDPEAIRDFLGERPDFADAARHRASGDLRPVHERPGPDQQQGPALSQAMDAARRVIPQVFAELEAMTGRAYPMLDAYRMDDAEIGAGAAQLGRGDGQGDRRRAARRRERVGVLSPNVLRPFPAEEIPRRAARSQALTIGDRADSYGARRRQPVARGARRAPASIRPTTRWCLRASTASAARISTRPTPSRSSLRRSTPHESRSRRRALRLPRRHARQARPRPTAGTAADRRAEVIARHGEVRPRRAQPDGGSRSSSSRCGR